MQSDTGLVYRGNFLLVQEYLAYLLQVKMKNPKSVERYRFWLNHLLLWAMEVPLQKAQFIKTPFADYVKHKKFAAESQKKIVETARAFLRWAKLYHEKQFASLPAFWVEDLTPIKVHRRSTDKYVSYELDFIHLNIYKKQGKLRQISSKRGVKCSPCPMNIAHCLPNCDPASRNGSGSWRWFC